MPNRKLYMISKKWGFFNGLILILLDIYFCYILFSPLSDVDLNHDDNNNKYKIRFVNSYLKP